ncbi:MAG: hypothetical protein IID37_14850, partial [Planctomycetes bacterium]|nr:hypothetical protein [Planctomycetota bacterium]
MSEKQSLEYGIAYYSRRFRGWSSANQFREVVIDDDAGLDAAYAEAQRWFAEQGLKCHRWAPAGGQATRGLADFLAARGFQRCEYTVLVLAKWVEIQRATGVKILPARAMRAALQATFLDERTDGAERARSGSAVNEVAIGAAEACEERLNDPQVDLLVAMACGEQAGRCAL